MNRIIPLLVSGGLSGSAACADSEISVARGLQVSIIGGCHDCHTEGYHQSEGVIDPQKALLWLARTLGNDLCAKSEIAGGASEREWFRAQYESPENAAAYGLVQRPRHG